MLPKQLVIEISCGNNQPSVNLHNKKYNRNIKNKQ